MDLTIIGGYFGERKRLGGGLEWTDHINVFLLGVIKKLEESDSIVIPFAKVGTGYSIEELTILR